MLAAVLALTFCFESTLFVEPDPAKAARYFQEAKWLSEDDGGKLWGKTLYGPMLFVDPQTRAAVANERPPVEGFREQGGVFLGSFPPGIGMANYALNWGGKRWTMVLWPLPENRAERATLMAHEMFHRIQLDLGFPGASPKNAHLERSDGRLWLQMEMAALARALIADDADVRNTATLDALLFRSKRRSLYPLAKTEEDALELNEGLAQFTGYMLRGGFEPESRQWLGNQLQSSLGKPSYTRTFAYWTGASYAFLLNLFDAAKFGETRWRGELKSDSGLADQLAARCGWTAPASLDSVVDRARAYGYDAVYAKEKELEAQRIAQQNAIRKRLLDGPILILPLEKMNISFDFRTIVSMADDGTYYGIATLNNEWGTLQATDGVLISNDFKLARVEAPASADALEGNGWKLTLKPGWRLVPDSRKGDFRLSRSPSPPKRGG